MNDQDLVTLPPHSEESERALVGCLMLADRDTLLSVLPEIHSGLFYDLRHDAISRAVKTASAANGVGDMVMTRQVLKDAGKLDDVGGQHYLVECCNAGVSGWNWPFHLTTLKDKAWRRMALKLAQRAKECAFNEAMDAEKLAREFGELSERIFASGSEPREWFKFYTPGECREFQPPSGFILVGDCHLTRGSVTVIAGAPGIGKSRAGTALAVAGATGANWFSLKVHQRFKTAILQGENGRYRLKTEFAELDDATLNEFIRVSDRPGYGLAFDSGEFRRALTKWLADFKPDVLVLDPWNGIARDDKQRDFREAFENIFDVLPKGEHAPAIVIIAHTRKPKADERKTGRALLHELSGSHALGSVPRCVFVLQAASDDETDNRVVWTCCKNNDGELGPPTAWHRCNGLFAPCVEFDWQEFDAPTKTGTGTITKPDMDALFAGGKRQIVRKIAVDELMEATGFTKTACYNALSLEGRFKAHLRADDGLLAWTP